jgi:hypothetical protein
VYKSGVANQRHPDQKLVAFALDKKLLEAIDSARGGADRSSYIREAIVDKLRLLNIPLPDAIQDAPDRAGKTYRPREAKPVSYAATAKAKKLALDLLSKAKKQPGDPEPKPKPGSK